MYDIITQAIFQSLECEMRFLARFDNASLRTALVLMMPQQDCEKPQTVEYEPTRRDHRPWPTDCLLTEPIYEKPFPL